MTSEKEALTTPQEIASIQDIENAIFSARVDGIMDKAGRTDKNEREYVFSQALAVYFMSLLRTKMSETPRPKLREAFYETTILVQSSDSGVSKCLNEILQKLPFDTGVKKAATEQDGAGTPVEDERSQTNQDVTGALES